MTLPTNTNPPDPFIVPDRPLATETVKYLNHLASFTWQTPLAIVVKIHPLNVTEGLARELGLQEQKLLSPNEKNAAHEFADPRDPDETAIERHQLAALIAEMVAPFADATLAHHLLFIMHFGKNISPPYALDRMAICASFDSTHGILRQRFAPDREKAPPVNAAPIPAGMTLVCEALETGFYRLPDDKRYRNSSGLSLNDALYEWTLKAALMFYAARAAGMQPGPSAEEIGTQASAQLRFLLRLLTLLNPETAYAAWAESNARNIQTLTSPSTAQTLPKIVLGRYASQGSTAPIRNFEHNAGSKMLERSRSSTQHPQQHLHFQKTDLTPE